MKKGLIIEKLETAKAEGIPHSVLSETVTEKGCSITTVEIKTDEDAKKLERDKGSYVTVEMNEVNEITDEDFESIVDTLAKIIKKLVSFCEKDRILIVGIGNKNVTPDSLGPKCIERIIVTRGLEKTMPHLISKDALANVCAICSDVFGVTGIESAELIDGISASIKPQLVIVVDALATNTLSRLCKTVQLSNTSISPGSGVGNERQEISPENIGVPMLSIGIPTVLDLETVLKNEGVKQLNFTDGLVVTPMNIQSATDRGAKLIAFALNKALHYDMSTEDILKFLY